jgi:hypothetical protein
MMLPSILGLGTLLVFALLFLSLTALKYYRMAIKYELALSQLSMATLSLVAGLEALTSQEQSSAATPTKPLS